MQFLRLSICLAVIFQVCTFRAVYAFQPEVKRWLVSDSPDFKEYEVTAYGDDLLLTKDMYGKYVKFEHVDMNGNVSQSEIKGPVVFSENSWQGRIDFDDNMGIKESYKDEEHFVECTDSKLWAKNSDGTGSNTAEILLPSTVLGADSPLEFSLCMQEGHSRVKIFFLDSNKNTVFTIYAVNREGRLVLTDTTSSQFSTALYKTDVEQEMKIRLRFDFDGGIVNIQNASSIEPSPNWSENSTYPISSSEVSYIAVSNEYLPCDIMLDDISVGLRDYRESAGIYGVICYKDNTIEAKVENFCKDKITADVIAAFYNGEYMTDIKVLSDVEIDYSRTLSFKTDKEYDRFKLFVWKDCNTAVPVAEYFAEEIE